MNRPSAAGSVDRPAGHWAEIGESGTATSLKLLWWLNGRIGRRAFRGVIALLSLWFVLLRPASRRVSLDFLRTHAARFPAAWTNTASGRQRDPGWRDAQRHFAAFGEMMLDKALAWNELPSESDFTLVDPTLVQATLADPRGQLVIGSHLGNLEYCRGFLGATHARIVNVLVYDKHSREFVRAMEKLSPDSRVHVFQVDEIDVGVVLELRARVARGEWLFIAGDRLPLSGEARTATVEFLGRPAAFPVGPYLLGKTLGCPVKLMFSYRKVDTVLVDLQAFADAIELPRGARDAALAEYAARFAAALEAHAREVPLQWFNFYPFWKA